MAGTLRLGHRHSSDRLAQVETSRLTSERSTEEPRSSARLSLAVQAMISQRVCYACLTQVQQATHIVNLIALANVFRLADMDDSNSEVCTLLNTLPSTAYVSFASIAAVVRQYRSKLQVLGTSRLSGWGTFWPRVLCKGSDEMATRAADSATRTCPSGIPADGWSVSSRAFEWTPTKDTYLLKQPTVHIRYQNTRCKHTIYSV